jgi:alpha 1,2-mannosyltransferase
MKAQQGGAKNNNPFCYSYMSWPIYQHPLLKDIDYSWRLEPETRHSCTYKSHWKKVDGKSEWVERDPFRYMRDNKKKYSWVISTLEYRGTVMSLMARVNRKCWRRWQ